MISAPPGLAARYKHTEPKQHWTYRRVIAFDDDWQPLVITDDHRLEYASRYSNYDGIDDVAPDHHDYTAIVAAGGWRVEYTGSDGTWSEPLVGWALKGGMVVPLSADCAGLVDDFDLFGGEYRIYHPDATEPGDIKTTVGSPPAAAQEGTNP
jgi:hypothetical protein